MIGTEPAAPAPLRSMRDMMTAGYQLPETYDQLAFKITRADLTTGQDYRWPWPGNVARPRSVDPPSAGVCAAGLHLARTATGAATVMYGPSTAIIAAVRNSDIIAADDDKMRVDAALVIDVVRLDRRIAHCGAGTMLPGLHLAGANLTHANLDRANLAGADLARADLYGADLAGADLARAYLAGANLACADLAGADLTRADLAGANLYGANLAGANLTRADLAGADLYGADLAGANLARANLARAYLACAYLACADLAGAYLAGANLYGAQIDAGNKVLDVLTDERRKSMIVTPERENQ